MVLPEIKVFFNKNGLEWTGAFPVGREVEWHGDRSMKHKSGGRVKPPNPLSLRRNLERTVHENRES